MTGQGRPRTRPALTAALAVLPWTWFVVRDTGVLLEWVAILLPLLAAVAVVLLVVAGAVRRRWWPLVLAVSTAAAAATATVAPWAPQPTPAPSVPLRVVAANALGDNERPEALGTDLLAADPDLVVVSEVSPVLLPLRERLDAAYPHRWAAGGQDAVAVWSRFPLEGRELADDGPLAAARGGRVVVRGPSGPFALYALHLYRPSRDAFLTEVTISEQARLVAALDALVREDPLPSMLVGDLNVSDRQRAYRVLVRDRVDAGRAGWTGPTSLRTRNRPLLLRIDHLLVPADWCATGARRLGLTGSDHRGVVADVGPCPAAPAEERTDRSGAA